MGLLAPLTPRHPLKSVDVNFIWLRNAQTKLSYAKIPNSEFNQTALTIIFELSSSRNDMTAPRIR